MSTPLVYQLRIRTPADDADDLVISSVAGDTYPYIAADGIPQGDGSQLDPLTGQVTVGAYTVQVIDAVDTVPAIDTSTSLTDGFEYANQGAMEAAGWIVIDTMSDGSIVFGATDQVYAGTKSLKMATTGTGTFAGDTVLRVYKEFDAGDGIVAHTDYRVTVRGRMNVKDWYDNSSRMSANGVLVSVGEGGVGAWEPLSVVCNSGASATVLVLLQRSHGYVTTTRDLWWDALTIETLAAGATTTGRIVTSRLTDSEGKQHLLSRKAYLEESTDNGSTWTVLTAGYVNRYTLVDALRWEFTIGESRRVEQSKQLFQHTSDPDDFPDLIGVMDRASCLIGGPIVGDFGPIQDRGRPLYEVTDVTTTDVGSTVTLQWISGYVSGPYNESEPPLRDSVSGFLNNGALDYLAPDGVTPYQSGLVQAPCPGLVGRVYDVGTGARIADHGVVAVQAASRSSIDVIDTATSWVVINKNAQVRFAWNGTAPSVGARYKLAVFPKDISERNPLHVSGHPMDFLGWCLDLIGQAYDDTSRLAVRALLGDDLTVEYRITKPMKAQDATEQYVYAPFGVAPRLTDAGELEFLLVRDPSADSVGLLTIDDLGSDAGNCFEVTESKAANLVTFTSQNFLFTAERLDSSAFDAIRVTKIIKNVNGKTADGTAVYGEHEVAWEIPGRIVGLVSGTTAVPGTLDLWIAAQASPLFDWQERGSVEGEFHVLRGVTTAKVGDIVTHAFAHVPTSSASQAPTSQRGTVQHRAIVLRRTVVPGGLVLLLQDRGETGAPVPPPFVPPLPCGTIDAPTALAATVAGTVVTLTWTTGADDVPLELSYTETGDTDLIALLVLPAGSTTATVTLPDGATDYTFSLRHREAPPRTCASDPITLDVTTDAAGTLSAPTDPAAYADGHGTFGLEVTATALDAAVNVWTAVETAVGSGTAGTYTEAGSTASVPGRTAFTVPVQAPNDGKLRFLRARHTKTGFTASAYTTPVSINPWLLIPAEDPVTPPADLPPSAQTPLLVPILGYTDPHEFAAVPAAVTPLTTTSVTQDQVPLGSLGPAVRGRLVVVVEETSVPVGCVIVGEFESAIDTWTALDDGGVFEVAVDAASLFDADSNPTINKAWASDWFTVRAAALGDVRVRACLKGGDDDADKVVSLPRVEFQFEPIPTEPEPEPKAPAPDDPCPDIQFVDFGDYADTAALLADWTEYDPSNIAGWSLVTPPVTDYSARVPKLLWSGTVPADYVTSISKVFGGFSAGATVRVRWYQYQNISSPNGPANQWNLARDEDQTADGSGNVTITLIWHETATVNESGHFMLFDRLSLLEDCGGSGTGLGDGDGVGGPGADPLPVPPTGGYPPPVTTGARRMALFNSTIEKLVYFDGTVKELSVSNVVNVLTAAIAANTCVYVLFGSQSDWKDSSGKWQFHLWKAKFDAIMAASGASAAFDAAITGGNVVHFLIDEPYTRGERYGWASGIPIASVEDMAHTSKAAKASLITMISIRPVQQAWWLTRNIAGLDWVEAEYSLNNGDCATFVDANIARGEALGFGVMVAPHLRHIEYPHTGSRYATPAEWQHYGSICASRSSNRGMLSWKYWEAMVNQAGWWPATKAVYDTLVANDP